MRKKKLSDKEIADGILLEVKNTMGRIEYAHRKALKDGPKKSDAYSRMRKEGWWDEKKILDEYVVIKKKESLLPTCLRQMIVTIFEVASTNFWAKQIKDDNDTQVKIQQSKKKKQ